MKNKLTFLLVLIVTLCFSTFEVYAAPATRTWTGAANNTNWNDASNWDTGVPSSDDKAVIDVAASGKYPVINSSVSV